MPRFPFNLSIPNPVYECHNIAFCPTGSFQPPDRFYWWDPASVYYNPPPGDHPADRASKPWQYKILYPVDITRPTPGWWCEDCISALQSFDHPDPTMTLMIPLTRWSSHHTTMDSQEPYDLVLTNITEPEPYFYCGHPVCPFPLPPEELTHCQQVYTSKLAPKQLNTDKHNHNWLCSDHTDEFYSNTIYEQYNSAQIGPTLSALLSIKNKPPTPSNRRRKGRSSKPKT